HQEHVAIAAGGSRCDRGISEVAAAGRRTAAAEEGQGRREVMTGCVAARDQGVKAAVIGIRLSGGAGGAGGRIASGLRRTGTGVAFLARRKSVAGLGGASAVN